jgi:hypothetical protein
MREWLEKPYRVATGRLVTLSPPRVGEQLQRADLVDLALVAAHQRVQHRREFGPLDRPDELVVGVDRDLERDRVSARGVGPALPGELLGAARMGTGRVQQIVQRVLVSGFVGRLKLEVEVLEEVGARDRGQLHLGGLAEDRLIGALQHHLQGVTDRTGEQQ